MTYKTLAQLRSKIELDLDLQDELFITAAELNDFINEAIDDVEAEIHSLYEDYFLSYANIALTQGTRLYSLPSDIYADKIRRIIYNNSAGTMYEIHQLKDRDGFMEQVVLDQYPSANFYKYRVVNLSATAGVQLMLSPPAQETSTTNVTIWYIRNANRLSADSDLCDIPEFYTYVVQYAKCRCYEKEPGHPNYQSSFMERDRLRSLMLSTLQSKIADGDNLIEMDLTHYEDMA